MDCCDCGQLQLWFHQPMIRLPNSKYILRFFPPKRKKKKHTNKGYGKT